MIKKVTITNYLGESMTYDIDGVQIDNPSGLIITSIDGLGPVKANINMVDLATTDGRLFNSARLTGRNIVIKALFTHATSIEEARLLSYKYFPVKSKVVFGIATDNRIGITEGYVESNEPDIFSENSSCQISILCESAYFDGGVTSTKFGSIKPVFTFPFGNGSLTEKEIMFSTVVSEGNYDEFVYDGDTDTGIKIEADILPDDITAKVTSLTISNDDGKKIAIDGTKIASQVPNTSPSGQLSTMIFRVDPKGRCTYFCQDYNGAVSYSFYNNNLYCLDSSNGALYVANGAAYDVDWVELFRSADLSGDTVFMFPHDRKLHFISYGTGVHYSWSSDSVLILEDDTPSLQNILGFEYGERPLNSDTIIVNVLPFNGTLHLFTRWSFNGEGGRYYNTHYKLSGTRWVVASTMPTIPPYYDDDYDLPEYFQEIVFENKLYLLSHNYESYYFTEETGWVECFGLPNVSEKNVLLANFNGTLHCIVNKVHYIFESATESWTTMPDLSISYYRSPSSTSLKVITGECCSGNYMYLIGNANTSTYTEEPNNTAFVYNDKIVISTVRGDKSVHLLRGKQNYNIINAVDKNPAWFQVHRGINNFLFSALPEKDYVVFTINATRWYEGV